MKKKRYKKMIDKKNGRLYSILLIVLLCIWLLPVQCRADTPERITYESPVFTENEKAAYPEEILEQNGKRYQRISVEIKNAERKGDLRYVSTTVPLQLEGGQEPPEQANITLICEVTGKEYQREVSLQEIREKAVFWADDFSFPLTIHGYYADVFYLGEYEIPSGADLAQYGNVFLDYLGLPQDCYRVERVEWSGESYERDGILCRDAVAYGEKMIRDVEVLYGGQVRTLNVPAKQYVAVYEEIVEAETYEESVPMETEESLEIMETEETMPIEQEEEDSFVEQVLRWIREHITVVVFSSLFVVAVLVWLLLLWFSGKKKKGKAGD